MDQQAWISKHGSEYRNQYTEIRIQKSECRDQDIEIRIQKSDQGDPVGAVGQPVVESIVASSS